MTAPLILGAMIVPVVLAWLAVIGWQLLVVAEVVIILAAAWNFDHGRRPGAANPFPDANRADFASPIGGNQLYSPIPKEAVESPSDQLGPSHDPRGRGASR